MGLKHKTRGKDPLAGAVIFDPYKNIAGRNILPVGAEDFVTGWAAQDSSVVTATAGQTDPWGGTTAVRLQITAGAGTASEKYAVGLPSPVTAGNTATAGIWAKANSGSYKITWGDRSAALSNTAFAQYTYTKTPSVSIGRLYITAPDPSSTIDITVCAPQANFTSLAPYTPPAGLPASLANYGAFGSAISAQLGSTAGADTNDPTWGANGLVFGTDDYCLGPTSLLATESQFTVIVASKQTAPATECIIGKHNATGNLAGNTGFRLIYYDATRVYANAYNSAGTNVAVPITVAVGNNNILGMRYNGALQAIANTTFSTASTPFVYAPDAGKNLTIGKYASGSAGYLNGTIYFAALFPRALSDGEYLRAYYKIKSILALRGVTV